MTKYILIEYKNQLYIILSDNTLFKFWSCDGFLWFHNEGDKYSIGKFPEYKIIGTYDMPLILITDHLANRLYKHIQSKYNLHFMCPNHDIIKNLFNKQYFRLSISIKRENNKSYKIEVKEDDTLFN